MATRALSPNQLDKRRQIVEAAKVVLLRDGLRSCTTREVADESPLTRSAIHYYFDSIDEIIAAAMGSLLDDFIAGLRAAAEGIDDAEGRFWATTRRYVESFQANRALLLLWYDFTLASAHKGELALVERTEEAIAEVLTGLLEDCGVGDSAARSRALLAYMLGTTVRQIVHPTPFETVAAELSTLSGLPLPAGAARA